MNNILSPQLRILLLAQLCNTNKLSYLFDFTTFDELPTMMRARCLGRTHDNSTDTDLEMRGYFQIRTHSDLQTQSSHFLLTGRWFRAPARLEPDISTFQ